MTPLQENILVIAIILANTFIAIGYFAIGFIKTLKKKKAK